MESVSITSTKAFYDEFKILIRCAAFPLIWVMTHEEDRACEIIRTVLGDMREGSGGEDEASLGLAYMEWSACYGIRTTDVPSRDGLCPIETNPKTLNIENAIQHVLDYPRDVVSVFKDAHRPLCDPTGIVVRKFRDVLYHLANMPGEDPPMKFLVVISPSLDIPDELQKDVVVLDLKLPTAPELKVQLEEVVSVLVDKKMSFKSDIPEEEIEAIVRAGQGLTCNEFSGAINKSLTKHRAIVPGVIAQEKAQIVKKSKTVTFSDPVSVDLVGGMDRLLEWLKLRKAAWSEKGQKFGLPSPRGVLLVGVQGCGKSLVCRAIASLFGLPLLVLDIGKLFSREMGGSEGLTRGTLKVVEAVAPCVLMLDEIGRGLSGSGSSDRTDGGTTDRVIGTILSWLEERTSSVYVCGTANSIQKLPAEIMRKKRFDEIWFVGLPSRPERRKIFYIHIQAKGRNPESYNLDELALATPHFSGAEIEQVVVEGLFLAFSEGEELQQKHLLAAARVLVPLYSTMKDDIQELERWVGYDPVRKDGTKARMASSCYELTGEEKKGTSSGNNIVKI